MVVSNHDEWAKGSSSHGTNVLAQNNSITETPDIKKRLKEIIKKKSLQFGNFTLASGAKSKYYFDLRKSTLDPEGSYLIGRLIYSLLRKKGIMAVGGLTMGADPISTSVAIISHLNGDPIPAFLVRKEKKKHGTQKLIEGNPVVDKVVAIVDDVVTKGDSVIRAIEAAVESGAKVKMVITLVDRMQDGRKKLEEVAKKLSQDYKYEPIFTIEDFGIRPD